MEVDKVSGARRVDDMQRFRALMAGVYGGIAISSCYGYTIFSSYISTKYGFDQRDLTTISTVGCVFLYFTIPLGFILDHFGPQAVFPIAGTFGFLGFLLFGLTFQGYIKPSVVTLAVFNGMLNWGCAGMESGVMMPLMLNFPRDTGAMVIIQKTFSGLGTSVLMAYFQGWFQDNYAAYAFFIAAQHAVCATLCFVFIRFPPYYLPLFNKSRTSPEKLKELHDTQQLYLKQKVSTRRLTIGYTLVGCCLVFLASQSIAMAYKGGENFHTKAVALAVVTVILVALFALMALPFQFLGAYIPVTPTHIPCIGIATVPTVPLETMVIADPNATMELMEEGTDTIGIGNLQPLDDTSSCSAYAAAAGMKGGEAEAQMEEEAAAQAEVKEVAKVQVLPQHPHNFFHNFLTIDLWCMWFTCFGMWGTPLVMQMNAAQIYKAVNHGESVKSTLTMYVSVMSIGSAIGRISMGVYDMVLSARQRSGKTTLLTTTILPLPACLSFFAFLLFAVLPAKALILPFLIGAMGNGTAWGIGLLSVRKMYAKDLGRHYTFCFSAAMLAVILLNSITFGRLNDREAKRLNTYPQCNAPSCVHTAMWILVAINGAAVCTAFIVHFRFRSFTIRELRRRAEQAIEEHNLIGSFEESVTKPPHYDDEYGKGEKVVENLSDLARGHAPDELELDPMMHTVFTPKEKDTPY